MTARQRASLRREEGFSVIEVLIAMLILIVGILAVLGSLVSASKLTLRSQEREAAIGFAEKQIESLRQQPFASLGMTSPLPSPSSTVTDPDYYTRSSPAACYDIQVDYQAGGSSLGCENFVTGGTVASASQTITGYQGLTGTYNTYVTWHTDGCITLLVLPICLDTSSEKRITVAVLPSSQAGTGTRKPIWVTSVVSDPTTAPLALP